VGPGVVSKAVTLCLGAQQQYRYLHIGFIMKLQLKCCIPTPHQKCTLSICILYFVVRPPAQCATAGGRAAYVIHQAGPVEEYPLCVALFRVQQLMEFRAMQQGLALSASRARRRSKQGA
jgi:hypothetical protein